jgi:F-type H+-transporting ATPase subunit a
MSIYAPLEQIGIPVVIQSALLAALLLLVTGIAIRRHLGTLSDSGLVPDSGVTLRNLLELGVGTLADLAKDVIGDEYRRFMGLLLTLFTFVLVSNFLGLVPAVGGATSFADTTWAWAAISFGVYNFVGIQKHGFRYILQFCGPGFDIPVAGRKLHFPVMFPFFLPLELLLHLARMLTLSIRLLANMFADHLLVGLWLTMVPFLVPTIFMGLGSVVAVVQAFVFTLLTMTYIGMALDEPH